MKEKETYTITFFHPQATKIEVNKGRDLLSAAVAAGVYINSSCGGDGVCGRCKVIVKRGEIKTEPSGRISKEEREKGYVLACQTTVHSDVEIDVPAESRLDLSKISEEDAKLLRLKGMYSQAVEVEKGKGVIEEDLFTHSPLATKLYLELPPPTLTDTVSDLERLYREIRKNKDIPIMQTGVTNIKRLGRLLRESDWKVTVLLGKRNGTVEIISVEPGDTSERNYGIALDVGTTTVSGQLVNLNTKEVLGTKATHNKQVSFGDDVITRIVYAAEGGGGLERLHHAVIDNINAIIQELAKEHDIDLNSINAVMSAGNTTMVHLLLRVDPTFIRREPYVSTANFVPVIRAQEAGIKVNPRGLLACVPGVSTYVGGDITAGVLACGLSRSDELTILIDVGTNGEIVLGNKEWMVSCSASAGPAFEGSGVKCGMRAASGAIQRVEISDADKVKLTTIGNAKPRGICGSGYIDSLAELFKKGIINRNGKYSEHLSSRIRTTEGEKEFVLAFKEEADVDYDIVITEADIENLKRSKGAIYSAGLVLLKKLNLEFKDIEQFYIAGGFGTYLDIDKAVTIGLLPDLDRSKFSFIGNSSLVGSREILLSYEAKKEAEEIAKKMTYIELSVEPSYMDEYGSALFFPHTDLGRFPSVKK